MSKRRRLRSLGGNNLVICGGMARKLGPQGSLWRALGGGEGGMWYELGIREMKK